MRRSRCASWCAPAARTRPRRGVVLFVHGAGTPAEVSFDPAYRGHSWMAYLAEAGYDVFSMDMTGYGRSTRPRPVADPCNFPSASQAQFVPGRSAAPCAASHPGPMTTMGSDWNDLDAVVDHLRALRRVDQVSLVAWSQGGRCRWAMARCPRSRRPTSSPAGTGR